MARCFTVVVALHFPSAGIRAGADRIGLNPWFANRQGRRRSPSSFGITDRRGSCDLQTRSAAGEQAGLAAKATSPTFR
jgi:hypothetical protein